MIRKRGQVFLLTRSHLSYHRYFKKPRSSDFPAIAAVLRAATTTTTTRHATSSYNYVNFFIDLGELDICTTRAILFLRIRYSTTTSLYPG